MTREEKIKVLAEMDGWTPYSPGDFNPTPRWINKVHTVRTLGELRCYLTSYDAIIPLVKKRCAGNALMEQTFINEVERSICSGFHAARTVGFFPMAADPEQLADALIKAVGKCKD